MIAELVYLERKIGNYKILSNFNLFIYFCINEYLFSLDFFG